jgi:hypothetical protein
VLPVIVLLCGGGAVCGILGSGEQTRIESCIIRIPESMVESHYSSPNKTWTYLTCMQTIPSTPCIFSNDLTSNNSPA